MPEQIAEILEHLSGRPKRLEELRSMLGNLEVRRKLLDYADAVWCYKSMSLDEFTNSDLSVMAFLKHRTFGKFRTKK